jgi:predicted unusual protein kinase regulating ubiquinone biosynthesis (AarF/ABC1/UbiB family)
MSQPFASRVPVGRAARAARLATLAGRLGTASEPSALGAERLAATLSELRGAALKLGQLFALQGPDLLPPGLELALAALREGATPAPLAQVEAVLRRELGRDWRSRLASFDPEPLAAASIGQVHAARARDGRELALKVQYPGIARGIDGDLDLAALLLRRTGLLSSGRPIEGALAQLKRELHRETDYRREARSTLAQRAWLAGDPDFVVPQVHLDLSTRRVLATERLRGLPIEDLRSPEHPPALRDRLGAALLALALRELFEARRVQTDPCFANHLFLPNARRIGLLDFGSVIELSAGRAHGLRALLRAAVDGDARDIAAAAAALDLLDGAESPSTRAAFEALVQTAAEPLRARGAYDFGRSDLAARVRALAAAAYRAPDLPVPPAELLLVQRKLAGTYLLLQHIGARAPARALYLAHG